MTLNSFQSPYVGVWLSVLIGSVICCAYIGSVVAFNAILSSAAIAVMMSYGMPIFVRVIWPESLPQAEQGPFRLGKYAWPVNLLSFAFTVFLLLSGVCFFLPSWHGHSMADYTSKGQEGLQMKQSLIRPRSIQSWSLPLSNRNRNYM